MLCFLYVYKTVFYVFRGTATSVMPQMETCMINFIFPSIQKKKIERRIQKEKVLLMLSKPLQLYAEPVLLN